MQAKARVSPKSRFDLNNFRANLLLFKSMLETCHIIWIPTIKSPINQYKDEKDKNQKNKAIIYEIEMAVFKFTPKVMAVE